MKTNLKTQHESIKAGTNHIKVLVGMLITGFIIVSGYTASAGEVVIYPAPAGEVSSSDYQVQVADQKIDTYMARVLDPPFAGKR